MHSESLEQWQHGHNFSDNNLQGERRVLWVLLLTATTMVVEIVAGTVYGSMALLADGWHMGTHVAAFFIAIVAYRFGRKHQYNKTFSFSTGKVNVLGGFSSAVALSVVALIMVIESVQRFYSPAAIAFDQAILVAVVGLIVNIASAFLLMDQHSHHHSHDHSHEHRHHRQQDHNLKAAYFHVLADALTSLLAIVALVLGKFLGWNALDPLMGVVGAIIITSWAYGLLRQTAPILLDASIEPDYRRQVVRTIEGHKDSRVVDLHIWKISANHFAAIISIVTHHPLASEHYRALLAEFDELAHLTIEVNYCDNRQQAA